MNYNIIDLWSGLEQELQVPLKLLNRLLEIEGFKQHDVSLFQIMSAPALLD
jgi:hypothetical protein